MHSYNTSEDFYRKTELNSDIRISKSNILLLRRYNSVTQVSYHDKNKQIKEHYHDH